MVTAVRAHSALLPTPPTDVERDLYLGSQWRWVPPLSFLGFLFIVVSLGFFVFQHPWSAWLLIPGAVCFFGSTLSLLTSNRARRDSLDSHLARVLSWNRSSAPSVSVLLPSAGESLDLLENTYQHVASLEWPGDMEILVLDDSARLEVAALADSYGFRYLTRPDRGAFKKAGNLRFGYDNSRGEIILVLDADFVPRQDALLHLAPYLDEPGVGIVQSPQFFDVLRSMNWLQRAAGATQILFYRWVQPSRDRSRAAICVGTSALYRRKALASAGGFALIGHSEDVHTGVRIMKAGFDVRYLPVVVTKGLCPSTLDQFMTQQYRWCSGSMSLLRSREFHAMPLTLAQRASYWSGFLYYISTALNVFIMLLPPIMLAWFVPAQVLPSNYIFIIMALVTRETVVPFITLQSETMTGLARVQTTYSFCHAVAIFDALRGRVDAWVATGTKSASPTPRRVRRLMQVWFIFVQTSLWCAVVIHVPTYGILKWSLLIIFTLLNAYIMLPLVIESLSPDLIHSIQRRAVDSMLRRWPFGREKISN